MGKRSSGSGAVHPETDDEDVGGLRLGGRIAAGAILAVLLVAGAGGWAATAQLSGAVIATGTVDVDQNLKAVQHRDGGIISEIAVEEGDFVDEGQVLIRLDDVQTKAELAIVASQLAEATVRRARLLAERDGTTSLSLAQVDAEPGNHLTALDLRRDPALGGQSQQPCFAEGAAGAGHRAARRRDPRARSPAGIEGQGDRAGVRRTHQDERTCRQAAGRVPQGARFGPRHGTHGRRAGGDRRRNRAFPRQDQRNPTADHRHRRGGAHRGAARIVRARAEDRRAGRAVALRSRTGCRAPTSAPRSQARSTSSTSTPSAA